MKTTGMLTWSNVRNTLFQENMRHNSFFEMLQYHLTTTREAPCQLGEPYNCRFGETRDTPIKPTIEFRQRVCPLDVEEIQHWVDLCQSGKMLDCLSFYLDGGMYIPVPFRPQSPLGSGILIGYTPNRAIGC
jgi:hypothetical protein